MGLRGYLPLIALALVTASAAELPKGLIRQLPLNERTVYDVGIHPNIPTTILLPSVPTTFQGTGFTRSRDRAAPVYLDYTEGTSFFSVRPLLPGAVADLNAIIDGKIYAFRFYLSEDPTRSLTLLLDSPRVNGAARSIHLKRSTLLQMLDDVKSYFVIKDQYPEMQRNIEVSAPGTVIDYPSFRLVVDQVFKFPEHDTIIFRIIFLNDSQQPMLYAPASLAVRIGTNDYFASFADASGDVPPATAISFKNAKGETATEKRPGQSFAYFAITGNPDGTRANISLKNTFNVLVNPLQNEPQAPASP